MAKSSKPKEIVVVGSKIKETSSAPAELQLQVGADVSGRLSWDVDLTPFRSSPLPDYALVFQQDTFDPLATVQLPGTTLTETPPPGITVGVNDNEAARGDEVWVFFSVADPTGNNYEVELYLRDPSGTALDGAGLKTPLDLDLADFETATLALNLPGGRGQPFATADVFSLESFVVPESTSLVLLVSMLGTFVAGKLFRR